MIHIDTPSDRTFPEAYGVIEGWLPCPRGRVPQAELMGTPIALYQAERADLATDAFGFRAFVDWRHVAAVAGGEARLAITIEGQGPRHVDFNVPETARAAAEAAREAKRAKRDWLASALRTPVTHEPVVRLDAAALVFADGRVLDQTGYGAINVLDPSLGPTRGFTGRLGDKADGVSAHPYPTLLEEHLTAERARCGAGFMALDFGAGVKTVDRADVIYMEVFDYPSTDLLTVGQALPFAEATFDMVCTLAVLEHVDDPFACAAEIVRVLKPGGAPLLRHPLHAARARLSGPLLQRDPAPATAGSTARRSGSSTILSTTISTPG